MLIMTLAVGFVKIYNGKTHLPNLSAITRSMRTITKITWRLLNS